MFHSLSWISSRSVLEHVSIAIGLVAIPLEDHNKFGANPSPLVMIID